MAPEAFPFPDEPLGGVPRSCAWRRAHDPLGEAELPSGDVVAVAVRHADVEAVLADPRFSRDLNRPGSPRLQPDADMSEDRDTLINLDPPRHTRLRQILNRSFSVRRSERWRPRIRVIVRELVDTMMAAGPPGDLMAALAQPLPIRVIAEILGVADADLAQFRRWAETAMTIGPERAAERAGEREEFYAYVGDLVARHRSEPGTDLLDDMIEARDGGDRLSEAELIDTVRSLLLAGHETTMTSIGRGAFTLLRHRDQYEELVADPALVPAAVEEILRHDFPADVGFLRVAVQDVELPSGCVHKGQGVMPLISSAHRDDAQFTDPDRFDIHRPMPKGHLAFGKGPHYCIGAHLARIQLQEAFDALVRGVPGLNLAVPAHEVPWQPGMVTHALAALPITW
ncbi:MULTISPECIES: cytochrome P450 [unclassified Streptomyces]|uniref:cytochrome P450 n=1 Tax=unclassified Streptomyces TaxID=2593676 RepID=UPI00382A42CD